VFQLATPRYTTRHAQCPMPMPWSEYFFLPCSCPACFGFNSQHLVQLFPCLASINSQHLVQLFPCSPSSWISPPSLLPAHQPTLSRSQALPYMLGKLCVSTEPTARGRLSACTAAIHPRGSAVEDELPSIYGSAWDRERVG